LSPEQSKRLLSKCCKIYERENSLHPVYRFLSRLELWTGCEENLAHTYYDDILIPEIKQRYFRDVTLETLLDKGLTIYRSTPDRSLALEKIWDAIEWWYPFDQRFYTKFTHQLHKRLDAEPDPPTKSDWDELEEMALK
jgi:hypothetical protein